MSTESMADVKTTFGQDVKVENIDSGVKPDAQVQTAPKSTLYRHPTAKLVGGVCGGLGWFGVASLGPIASRSDCQASC